MSRRLRRKGSQRRVGIAYGIRSYRKPLEQPAPFEASWELRCGPDNRFRVFYEVDSGSQEVHVLAIGVKDRERLLIGGQEYKP